MQFGRFDDLRNPAVVIGFSGWNDAGNAASDLLRHLMEAYPGTDLGVIDDERYFDFQHTRPMLNQAADGPWVEWPALRIRAVHHPARDIVTVIGPEPNLLWRTFTRELVDKVKEARPELVIFLGAMLSDKRGAKGRVEAHVPIGDGRIFGRRRHRAGPRRRQRLRRGQRLGLVRRRRRRRRWRRRGFDEGDVDHVLFLCVLRRRRNRRQQQQQGRRMQGDGKADARDARPAQTAIAVVILLGVGEILRHAHGSGVGNPDPGTGATTCGAERRRNHLVYTNPLRLFQARIMVQASFGHPVPTFAQRARIFLASSGFFRPLSSAF